VSVAEMNSRSMPVPADTIQGCESCDRGVLCFDPSAAERARASRITTEDRPTRVVLCSDQPIMRSALHLLIDTRPQYDVAIETAICPNALHQLDGIGIDVLLLDFDLNDGSVDRLAGLQSLLAAGPTVPVLILTLDPDAEACQVAFRLGIRGIVLKSKRLDDLFGAIDRIRRGDTWLEGPALQKLLEQSNKGKKTNAEDVRIALLTKREREIVKVVAGGRTNKQVSEELFISDATVRHHLCTIFDKLGVSSRGELIVYAYRNGIADRKTLESN
jgi:two-component system nitrate/nitrite response regulator NarL